MNHYDIVEDRLKIFSNVFQVYKEMLNLSGRDITIGTLHYSTYHIVTLKSLVFTSSHFLSLFSSIKKMKKIFKDNCIFK